MTSTRLDDRALIERLDPGGIFRLTREFPQQCAKALQIGERFELGALLDAQLDNVILAGVGGSAAGGDFLQALFTIEGRCPFFVSRGYDLPAWTNSKSLVICSSYSGNTEETLSAYAAAISAGARILCVTSGGTLAAAAEHAGVGCVLIPGGQPPRTALGYSLLSTLTMMRKLGLVTSGAGRLTELLKEGVEAWDVAAPFDRNLAKQIALDMHETIPVLYGLGLWQGVVAWRWKAQINENAKRPAFANTIPELNHNEILGWTGMREGEALSCFLLEGGNETAKMRARGRFTLEAVPPPLATRRITAAGATLLDKMLSLSLLGDFVSLYLAVLCEVDPEDISLLTRLKHELANVN